VRSWCGHGAAMVWFPCIGWDMGWKWRWQGRKGPKRAFSSTLGAGAVILPQFMRNILFLGLARRWFAASICVFLFAAGVQAKPAVIVNNGRSSYLIVTPDAPSQAVDYAANELQGFIPRPFRRRVAGGRRKGRGPQTGVPAGALPPKPKGRIDRAGRSASGGWGAD